MEGRADLHIHTTFSDGALSPRAIVDHAVHAGLATISITDHDHTGAIDDALSYGRLKGVDVIPGVELSATVDGEDIHILGYYIDHGGGRLQEYLARFREQRLLRAERIVGKLHDLNIPLPFEAVERQATGGSLGRPHIANALLERGFTGTYHEAFLKYIGFGKPAYEPKMFITPRDAVDLIASSGGLSFVAHPGSCVSDAILLELIRAGVDGIEVIHPAHSTDQMVHYSGIASEYFLLTSGGSDFHGGGKAGADVLGRYVIPLSMVEDMRRRLR